VGSSARLPFDCDCLARHTAALAPAAGGPNRPGLRRCRQGGQEACRAWWQGEAGLKRLGNFPSELGFLE
jgi:hypothetical protein